MTALSRRSFVTAATLGSVTVFARTLRAADYNFVQYHNQTAGRAHCIARLVEMWAAIRMETAGRVEGQVFPENSEITGSDPAALKLLIAGEIQFFTLMGGILGTSCRSRKRSRCRSHSDPPRMHTRRSTVPWAYVAQEMESQGYPRVSPSAPSTTACARSPARRTDRHARRSRRSQDARPGGQLVADTFRAFGAGRSSINSNGIYDALKSGTVDAQENPLALVELFRLFDVVKYVSMTNHMWSGFNQLAHRPTWERLPATSRPSSIGTSRRSCGSSARIRNG